jgi:hypothetical protein
MGNEIKEEQIIPKLAGGEAGNNNKRGGRRARNRWNDAAGGTQTGNKFRSRNKDIAKDLVFDNTGPNNAANF